MGSLISHWGNCAVYSIYFSRILLYMRKKAPVYGFVEEIKNQLTHILVVSCLSNVAFKRGICCIRYHYLQPVCYRL